MRIKVVFGNEIHACSSEVKTFESFKQFISLSFKSLPQQFSLYYIDQDHDQITVSCEEDFLALQEYQNFQSNLETSSVKVYISSLGDQVLSKQALEQSHLKEISDQSGFEFVVNQQQQQGEEGELTVLPDSLQQESWMKIAESQKQQEKIQTQEQKYLKKVVGKTSDEVAAEQQEIEQEKEKMNSQIKYKYISYVPKTNQKGEFEVYVEEKIDEIKDISKKVYEQNVSYETKEWVSQTFSQIKGWF